MKKILNFLKTLKAEFLFVAVFIAVHIPSLGHEIFNTDVWKWKSRIFNFGSGIFGFDFAQTLQRYHPGVSLMWLGTIAVKLNSFYYKVILGINPPDNDISVVFTLHFFQKLTIVVAIALTLGSVFYVLRKLFSRRYAVIFAAILTFEPFYLGLTRVVHLEGLMSTFMLASFVWYYYFLEIWKDQDKLDKNTRLPFFISGIFTALAVLTKTSALFMVLFIALITFTNFLLTDKRKDFSTKLIFSAFVRSLFPFLKWLGIVLVSIFVLWPALWVAPLDVLAKLQEGVVDTGVVEGHVQLYFGRLVQDPGFSFYPIVFLFRASPILLVGFVGGFFIKWKSRIPKRFLLYVLFFVGFYTLEMSIPSKKLDRYLLPAIVGSVLFASSFYYWLLEKIQALSFWRSYGILLFLLFLSALRVHPDYFSYYNPMFGGLRQGMFVIEPKWLIGSPEISEYFSEMLAKGDYSSFGQNESFDTLFANEELGNRLVVGFPEKYYTQVYPFIQEIGAWATIKDLTPHAKETTFFVYPVWEDDSYKEDRFKIEYVGSIEIRNVRAYNVYRRINEE